MSLPPRYYVLLIYFLKVKELLNNSGIRSTSPGNCNSLGAGILNETSRNKEIIKVNVVARPLRRLRQAINQVQYYCLGLIPPISFSFCPTKLSWSTYSLRTIFDSRNMPVPDD